MIDVSVFIFVTCRTSARYSFIRPRRCILHVPKKLVCVIHSRTTELTGEGWGQLSVLE